MKHSDQEPAPSSIKHDAHPAYYGFRRQSARIVLQPSDFAMSSGILFEPHHTIAVDYPRLVLIGEGEEFFALPPKDVSSRYEPLPLIDHRQVIRYTDFYDLSVHDFGSMTKASFTNSANFALASSSLPDGERFVEDITRLCKCHGRTMLHIVTFIKKMDDSSNDPSEFYIRIRCHAKVISKTHTSDFRCIDYVVCSSTFTAVGSGPHGSELWNRNICHLIFRDNDVAVRHVGKHLGAVLSHAEQLNWRPKRVVKIVLLAGHRHLTREELDERVGRESPINQPGARCCPICYLDFDFERTTPVQLRPCSHYFCEACLERIYDADHFLACCPLCKLSLNVAPDTHVSILFGEVHNRDNDATKRNDAYEYIWDDRYNKWENFERSCADIDQYRPKDNPDDKITVNTPILIAAWEHFVEHARQEPETSRPKHLNTALSEYFHIASNAIVAFVREIHGATLSSNSLARFLRAEIRRAFLKRFLLSPLCQLAKEEELFDMAFVHPTQCAGLDLRSTFFLDVRRWAHRMINFGRYRQCACGKDGLHGHGACRMFYHDANATFRRRTPMSGPEEEG